MADIVVVGGGGHAKVIVSLLRKLGWDILGYVDTRPGGALLGVPRLGDDAELSRLHGGRPEVPAALGVGKMDASGGRRSLLRRLQAIGLDLPALVSPDAVVNEDISLGAGSVVFDGAVVNSGTRAGDGCIVNTNSTVEHDCRLGDDVHVAPGATVCGGTSIGAGCMIGAGAVLIQGVTICPGCLVAAGATVIADLTEPGVYAGSPVRRIG